MSGIFIALEGPDGSGTSLHSRLLAERLQQTGKDVLLTKEPTDGQYGQEIREILMSDAQLKPEEIQQLFCLDRSDHVEQVIKPVLDSGKIVVCDRYIPSTLIYGEATGVPRDTLEKWNVPFPKLDVLIITLPPFEICCERVGRRDGKDIFEKKEFQRVIYSAYERYIQDHPEAVVIDTSGEKQDVTEHLWDLVGGVKVSS